jgi:hypothetical protein
VLSALLQAIGGFIFVDALNVVTLAAATVLQINTRQSTQPLLDTQSFLVSNPANTGFTITVLMNLSTGSLLHIRIQRTNRLRGLLDGSRVIGEGCSAGRNAILVTFCSCSDTGRQSAPIG